MRSRPKGETRPCPERAAPGAAEKTCRQRNTPTSQAPAGPWSRPPRPRFWAVVSVAGWALVAALVWILGPDQASQTATDEDTRDIRDVAPASGPEADN